MHPPPAALLEVSLVGWRGCRQTTLHVCLVPRQQQRQQRQQRCAGMPIMKLTQGCCHLSLQGADGADAPGGARLEPSHMVGLAMLLPLLGLCSAKHPLAAPPLCMHRYQPFLMCALLVADAVCVELDAHTNVHLGFTYAGMMR